MQLLWSKLYNTGQFSTVPDVTPRKTHRQNVGAFSEPQGSYNPNGFSRWEVELLGATVMSSDGNNNWSKLDAQDKKAYWWAGASFLKEHKDGSEWSVVEGDSDDQYFNFYLVCVDMDGCVTRYRSRHIPKDTYTTEQAWDAIESLKSDYWDIYAE